MTKGRRAGHRLMWLILAPVLAAVVWLAISLRPAEPINEALPAPLIEEAS